jgi:hypothetical protein
MSFAGRLYQFAFAIALAVAVLLPIDKDFRRVGDDFPFSFYPMFAGARPTRERPIYAVGVWPEGREAYITTGRWSTGGFNEGRTQLANAVRNGTDAKMRFCRRIAGNIARSRTFAGAAHVEIRQASIDRAEWFLNGKVATQARSLARCPVGAP